MLENNSHACESRTTLEWLLFAFEPSAGCKPSANVHDGQGTSQTPGEPLTLFLAMS